MKIPYISAGHSDTDPGAIACDAVTTESMIVLRLRNEIVYALQQQGLRAEYDGSSSSENAPRNTAIEQARAVSGIKLDLHCNSHTNAAATGVEVIALEMHRASARTLARAVAEALELPLRGDGGWIPDTQSARKRLAWMDANRKNPKGPGWYLLECGFISNPRDFAHIQTRTSVVASVIADWVIRESADAKPVPRR